MSRYFLMLGIGFGGLALLQLVLIVLLSKSRGGYKRGREEGFELGFEAGQIHADGWWCEADRQVEREREKIRNEERRP